MSPAGKLVFAQLFVPEVRAGTLVRHIHARARVRVSDARCCAVHKEAKTRTNGQRLLPSCSDLSFFLVVVCIIVLGFISNQRWVGRSGRRIVYRCPAVSLMRLLRLGRSTAAAISSCCAPQPLQPRENSPRAGRRNGPNSAICCQKLC